jgi:pimeloyl-ACP methyl ester carboxylesterase
MHLTRRLRLASLPLALLAGTSMADPISIESIAREPSIRSVSMSIDGTQISAIIAAPGSDYRETALATWDLDNFDKGPAITPSGDRMKFIGARELKAGKTSVIGRQELTGALGGCAEGNAIGSEATFIVKNYLTDSTHSDFEPAFESGERMRGVSERTKRCAELNTSARLVSTLPLDPTRVIISRTDMVTFVGNFYFYDVTTERTELLFRGNPESTAGLFDDRTGQLLTRTDIEYFGDNEYKQTVLIRDPKTDEFEVHDKLTTMLTDRNQLEILERDEETGKYYVLTDKFSDLVQIWMYDAQTREFDAEPLLAHPQFNVAGLSFGNQPSNFNKIIAYTIEGPDFETTYIDPDMGAIHAGLQQVYKGQNISLQAYNNDLSRILFTTESNKNPRTYHLLQDRKTVKTLGSERPWINPEDLGEQRWITYTARDGMKIPAILDLPAGYNKETDGPIPLVVNPHGGPWARDYTGWDVSGWVPFLTSRGYAVLRPQYRGSTGLGRQLWTAGDAQWGLKMQEDKDDGAQYLVEQGIADPDNMLIFGYSYGGFAAAAASVLPDSPYRCAISGAPVTDLGRIGNNWSRNRVQRALQGVTVKGMDPMENTGKVHMPVLLYVGSRDVRTPSFHAENFYNAIKDKVPARYELIEDMPHSLPWYYRHHEQTLTLIEDFLEQECGMPQMTVASN